MTKTLVVPKSQAVAVQPQSSSALMSFIERALFDPNVDPKKLADLLTVKKEWDADEARKAFNAAFAAFKSEAVKIIKNTEVKDGPLKGKKHANLFDVVNATTPHLSKHGLTISWKPTKDEPSWMEITCILRHVGGHSESVSMGGAPDTGPGRNAIQSRGSAKSYLERYTATAILGLAAQDADTDGRTPTKMEPIPGPKEAKNHAPKQTPIKPTAIAPPVVERGKDSFTIKTPFLFTVKDGVEFRGPTKEQHYRIDPIAAKTAKNSFKDGETAELSWEIRDGVKWIVDLDRKVAADTSGF